MDINSNTFFKRILDSMNDSISIINVGDFRILEANSALLKDLGLREDEVIGKTCHEVTHSRNIPCEPPDDICPLLETVKTGSHASVEHVHYRKDGSKMYVEVTTSPIKDADGNVIQVIHISRDITGRRVAEELLREQKEFAGNLIQLSAVAAFVIDAGHKVMHWNRACEELTGIKASEMTATDNHWKAFYPHKRPCLADIVIDGEIESMPKHYSIYGKSTLISNGLHAEGWYPNLGGKERYIIFEAAPIFSSKGKLIAAIETLQDITSRLNLEKQLRESEELFRILAENLLTGVSLYQEKFLYVNPAMERITGYTPEELLQMHPWEVVHAEFAEKIKKAANETLNGLKITVPDAEVKLITKQGEEKWVQTSSDAVIYKEKFSGLVAMTDITGKKNLEEELIRAATIDNLTGIYNRHKFENILENEIRRTRRYKNPFSLIMFDIDHFKAVNDTYGHQTGDYVLKTIAAIVKTNLRKIDSFGRWGGEEFMVLVPETLLKHSMLLVEKLRKVIANHVFEEAGAITVSLGVTQFRDEDTMDSLIKRVDDALYIAKNSGRNRAHIVE